ncbi:MAG TPA: hypothetical protein DCP92_15865 [Nitrospiraceae bacterium]|jgi:hypothetical protein|nr:hypothetical protein [Nitrospiraceae bacterium]
MLLFNGCSDISCAGAPRVCMADFIVKFPVNLINDEVDTFILFENCGYLLIDIFFGLQLIGIQASL